MAFTHYTAFTVETGQVPSTQTDFPVLLKPTEDRFRTTGNGGNVANASGFDLRPYADSGGSSALTYELVAGTYSATTGTFEMWVKVPSLQDGTVIYLFYGDAALSSDGSSTSTWDSSFKGVFHFPDGSSLSVANSSQTSISPTNNGVLAAAGRADGGAEGDTGAFINLGTVAGLNINGDLTLSAWVLTTESSGRVLIGGYQSGSGFPGYGMAININTIGRMDLWIGEGNWFSSGGLGSFRDGGWHYAAVTFQTSGNVVRWYYDGAADGTPAVGGTPVLNYSGDRRLFNSVAGGSDWVGRADEIRIAAGIRSADWIETEYNNQIAPVLFYSIGTEQSAGGPSATPSLTRLNASPLRWR